MHTTAHASRRPWATIRSTARYEAKEKEHVLLGWAGARRTDEDGPVRAAGADGQPQPRPRRAGGAARGGGRLPQAQPARRRDQGGQGATDGRRRDGRYLIWGTIFGARRCGAGTER